MVSPSDDINSGRVACFTECRGKEERGVSERVGLLTSPPWHATLGPTMTTTSNSYQEARSWGGTATKFRQGAVSAYRSAD